MNFELTDIQRDIQRMCREFAAKELIPNARKWDETHAWPDRGGEEARRSWRCWAWRCPSSTAAPGWTTSATPSPWRRSAAAAPPPASS